MTSAQLPIRSTYAQLRDRARPSIADRLPLEAPFALNLETTNACNFKCRMCPVSFDDYEQAVGGIATIPLARIERLFDEIAGWSPLKVLRVHSEGEPLVNKDIAAVVRAANDRRIAERVELTTNGSALTERAAAALIDAELTYLRVSVYGATDERHRFVTQSKIPVERIRKNVQAMRRLRDERGRALPWIYVKMLDSKDERENQAFFDAYRPIADEVELEQPMDWNSFDSRDLIGAAYLSNKPSAKQATRQVCAYPFYSLVIKANGDVVACCVDWNKLTKVGNIHEQTLREIWRGAELRAFRRMQLERRRHENPSCRKCTFFLDVPDDLDGIPAADFERVLGPPAGAR